MKLNKSVLACHGVTAWVKNYNFFFEEVFRSKKKKKMFGLIRVEQVYPVAQLDKWLFHFNFSSSILAVYSIKWIKIIHLYSAKAEEVSALSSKAEVATLKMYRWEI